MGLILGGGSADGGGGGDGHTLPPSATSQDITDATSTTAKLFSPDQIAKIVHEHKGVSELSQTFPLPPSNQVTPYRLTADSFDAVTRKTKLFSFGASGSGHVEFSISDESGIKDDVVYVASSRAGEIRFTSGANDIRWGNRDPQVIKNGQVAVLRRLSEGWWVVDVGLGEDEINVLKHFSYDADRDLVSMDVALSTTLSTVWLSDQWGFKSGGKSVFFHSTDQDTNFSPLMRGVKNQAIPANQDASGVVAPFYRKYSDTLLQGSLKGVMSNLANEVAPYEGVSTLTANTAVFGVRAVLGEDLKLGDKLWYRLWDGMTDAGPKLFEQSLTVTADRAAGFDFIGWWSAPSEGFDEGVVLARITVDPADGSPVRTLMVRATTEDTNVHWNELQYRTFEDIEIPLVAGATGHDLVLRSATTGNMSMTQAMSDKTLIMDVGGATSINAWDIENGFKVKIINPHATQDRFINFSGYGAVVSSTGFPSTGGAATSGVSVRTNSSITITVDKVSAGQPNVYIENHNPVADLERRTGDDRLDAMALKNGTKARLQRDSLTLYDGPYLAAKQTVLAVLPTDGTRIIDIDLTTFTGVCEINWAWIYDVVINTTVRFLPTSYLADDTVQFNTNDPGVSSLTATVVQAGAGTSIPKPVICKLFLTRHQDIVHFHYYTEGITGELLPANTKEGFIDPAVDPSFTLWAQQGGNGLVGGEFNLLVVK